MLYCCTLYLLKQYALASWAAAAYAWYTWLVFAASLMEIIIFTRERRGTPSYAGDATRARKRCGWQPVRRALRFSVHNNILLLSPTAAAAASVVMNNYYRIRVYAGLKTSSADYSGWAGGWVGGWTTLRARVQSALRLADARRFCKVSIFFM